MGSGLSIVIRACVPVPYVVHEARKRRRPSSVTKENCESSMTYTEFRLVDGDVFNPEMLMGLSKETMAPPSLRLLASETTPQFLSLLDLDDEAAFPFLYEALRCRQCAERIGMVIDPSVRIGQRLYTSEQRHAFTQGFSIFLSKLVRAIKNVAPSCHHSWGHGGSRRESLTNDLVTTQPNSPSTNSSRISHELFLLEVQNGLLDDASGPWLIRDIVDHMGRVVHYHSAVSQICSLNTSILTAPRASLEPRVSEERSNSSHALTEFRAPSERNNTSLSPFDDTEVAFCRSLRYVLLSENNMSRVGLRKCLEDLLKNNDQDQKSSMQSLQMIDVRQNEESEVAQRFVSELSSYSGVQIVIGTSGKRWRHRISYLLDKNVNQYDVGTSATMRHKLLEGTPTERTYVTSPHNVYQTEGTELVCFPSLKEKSSAISAKMSYSSSPSVGPQFGRSEQTETGKKGSGKYPPDDEAKKSNATHSDLAASGQEGDENTEQKAEPYKEFIPLASFLLNDEDETNAGEVDEKQMHSMRLDAAGETEVEETHSKELLENQGGAPPESSLIYSSPSRLIQQPDPDDDPQNVLATVYPVKVAPPYSILPAPSRKSPAKMGSSSSSYIVGREDSPAAAHANVSTPSSQVKKKRRPVLYNTPHSSRSEISSSVSKRPQRLSRDAGGPRSKNHGLHQQKP